MSQYELYYQVVTLGKVNTTALSPIDARVWGSYNIYSLYT